MDAYRTFNDVEVRIHKDGYTSEARDFLSDVREEWQFEKHTGCQLCLLHGFQRLASWYLVVI